MAELRVFAVYNRNYTPRYVVADDVEQALLLAKTSGHMRATHHARRVLDVTADLLDAPEGKDTLEALLNQETRGVIELRDGVGWCAATRGAR